jgi:cobalt-zinc-cadmium efflux system protein
MSSTVPHHEHEHDHGHDHHDHGHDHADDHGHDHAREHGHGHTHGHEGAGHHHGAHGHHHHAPPDQLTRAFAIGIALNIIFVAIEAAYGLIAGSLALIADAGHNLSDVLSLVLAWGANRLARRKATPYRTYGLRRGTILSSLLSSALLLGAMGAIAWEAIQRFSQPAEVAGGTMIGVATAGVVINGITAWLFAAGRHTDLNVRAAFMHMVADAAVSVAVVIGGFGVLFLGWLWLDPAITLIIVVVIVIGTWDILTGSLDLAFDAVPKGVDPHQVREYLQRLPGVASIHDLHIWAMSTTETALTAHLVVPGDPHTDSFLHGIAQELDHRFGISHSTLQVESGTGPECDQTC